MSTHQGCWRCRENANTSVEEPPKEECGRLAVRGEDRLDGPHYYFCTLLPGHEGSCHRHLLGMNVERGPERARVGWDRLVRVRALSSIRSGSNRRVSRRGQEGLVRMTPLEFAIATWEGQHVPVLWDGYRGNRRVPASHLVMIVPTPDTEKGGTP